MSAVISTPVPLAASRRKHTTIAWVPVLLTVLALAYLVLVLFLPMAVVFIEG